MTKRSWCTAKSKSQNVTTLVGPDGQSGEYDNGPVVGAGHFGFVPQ
jgi:hypothetical protein